MKNNQLLKRRKNLKLALLYAMTAFSVVVTVMFMVFFMLGYRFDANNGQIEQYALLQFNTMPTGATVKVDGVEISSKTPCKTSIPAGKHEIVMKKDGYEQWQKVVDVKSGSMTWLDYAVLIPNKLSSENIASFTNISRTLASVDGKSMAIQESASSGALTIVDISSESAKTTKFNLPDNIITSGIDPTKSLFNLYKWDASGKYLLINHLYDDKNEWIVIDTQNETRSKNITKVFNIAISDIEFLGTGGNNFYVLNSGDIRKINLSDGTISKQLIGGVKNFNLNHESNIMSFVAANTADNNLLSVGIYRDGDSRSYVLRDIQSSHAVKTVISRYFNEEYVAIQDNATIDILRGSYPNFQTEIASAVKQFSTLTSESAVSGIKFSPTGQYLAVEMSNKLMTYDLEYQKTATIDIANSTQSIGMGWISDDYLWSNRDGKLFMYEFDGTNSHQLSDTLVGQDAAMSHTNRYVYHVVKVDKAYQLQRTRLVIP